MITTTTTITNNNNNTTKNNTRNSKFPNKAKPWRIHVGLVIMSLCEHDDNGD